jgi:hypothetical protein
MTQPSRSLGDRVSTQVLRGICAAVAIAIAGLQAMGHRNAMNPDGISYLDIARAYLAGDIGTALNAYWGPLYSWLLAAGLYLTDPSPLDEFAVVHAVNFAIFLIALGAFDFALRALVSYQQEQAQFGTIPALSEAGLIVFGYSVFIYGVLHLIGLERVSPDLAVAAIVFGATGLLLRMRTNGASLKLALLLGTVLGAGYLTKSVMFVLSFVFLLALLKVSANRGRWRRLAIAAAGFLAIASVLAIPISRSLGRPTFGTAGPLTYEFEVNEGVKAWDAGQSAKAQEDLGAVHPAREIRTEPSVFDYSAHLRGSYPPWFDPSWWNAGIRTRIETEKQALQLLRAVDFYARIFLVDLGAALILIGVIWISADYRTSLGALRSYWPVLLPSVAALVVYAPVRVAGRFIGAFATVILIVLAASARRPTGQRSRGWLEHAALICAAALVLPIGFSAIRDWWVGRSEPNLPAKIALGLHDLGIRPGDRVGYIGGGANEVGLSEFWPHLAQVQVVAEVRDRDRVLCDKPATLRVLAAFASVGARAAVTRIPLEQCTKDWRAIAGTDYYLRLISLTAPLTSPDTTIPELTRLH